MKFYSWELKGAVKLNSRCKRFSTCSKNVIFCILQPCPESVPYKVALHNHKILVSSTESKDSLEKQV